MRCRAGDTTSVNVMGIILRQTASNTAYRAHINPHNNSQGVTLSRIVSGTNTQIATAAFTAAASTYYWMRFRVVGSNLFVRVWADGSGEPGTWNISTTDSNITGAGGFGLQINSSSSSSTWDFDSFTVTDATLTDTAPVRVRLAATNTQSVGARFLLRTLHTVTVGARTILGTGGGTTKKSVGVRARLRATATRLVSVRLLLRLPPVTKSAPVRTRLSVQHVLTTPVRALIRATNSASVGVRLILNPVRTQSVGVRLILVTPALASGQFTLFANGTGTASFDHFRVTEYPDPALSLAPITPRIGASGVSWNANVPTNTTLGIDISYDGVNWTDVSSGNGAALPTLYMQPDPTVDTFAANSSANYTSTFRTGGGTLTATFDTTNSRLILTGGTNGLYLYTAISRADVDFFADMDQTDAGGLVWRFVSQSNYYWLDINDNLTASGANTITLYKVASNVQTQLGTATISYQVGPVGNLTTVTFVRGTYHRFRVSMLGGVITVYVDGVSLITYTDGSPLAAGQIGMVNSGGTIGSRYYQLWIQPQGDYVSGTPAGDTVTGDFVYTRARLATTDPTVTPQVYDLTTNAFTPDIRLGVSIPSAVYNAAFISKNFDDLTKQSSNYFWYFKPDKTFVFRPSSIVAAPWILQSAPAGLVNVVDLEVNTDLELDVSNDLYRNRQIILGALDSGTFTETKTGDGSTRTFTLGYPLAAVPTSITLNGIAKTNIGLKGTTGYDYYYALNDPVIVQDASNAVLQAGDALTVTYTGFFATTVTVDNTTEQTARAAIEGGTGIVEAVEDHTGQNMTKAAAITLANQLLARYALAGRTLIFDTTRDGLAVGQILSVQLPEHGLIDAQLFITDVEIKLMKGLNDTQVWLYKVTASELPRKASWAKLIATGLSLT